MKIRSLRIEKFGHFTDTTVDFGPGLTVIHGPNEAGKSTLLDALGAFLWGVPRSNQRAFAFPAGKASLTGTIASGDIAVQVKRRLAALTCADNAFEPPWGPATKESDGQWRTAFGLDTAGLRDGGRKVIAGGGDLANLISLAESGELLSALIDKLTARADALHKPNRNAGGEIRTAIATIEAVETRIDETEASADVVSSLREQLAHKRRRETELKDELAQHNRTRRGLDEAARCFEPAAQLAQAEQDLRQSLGNEPALDRATATELAAAEASRAKSAEEIARLNRDRAYAQARRNQLASQPLVLAAQDEITGLREQLAARRDDQSITGSQVAARHARAALVSVLGGLGQHRVGDPAETAAALLLPDPIRQQLNRLANRAVQAVAEHQRSALEEAELTRTDADARMSEDDEGSTALGEARSVRQSIWSTIRTPWLSGELPGGSERARMADDLDRSIMAADEVAQDWTDTVKAQATDRGAAQERSRILARARTALAAAQDAVATAEANWRELARHHNLPTGLDAAGWQLYNEALTDLAEAFGQVESEEQTRREAAARLSEFAERARPLEALLAERHTDPLRLVEALSKALTEAIEARATDQELQENLQRIDEALAGAAQQATDAQTGIDRIVAGNDVPVAELLERSARLHAAQDSVTDALARLRAAKNPESDVDQLRTTLEDCDVAVVTADLAGVGSAIDAIEAELALLLQDMGGLRGDLRALEARESVADLRADLHGHGGHLRTLLEEYRTLRLQIGLLNAYKQRLADTSESPLLNLAGDYLSTLTSGRFTGFAVVEDGGARRIEIRFNNPDQPGESERVNLTALSEGTADQVFLALRLAGITMRQQQRAGAGLAAVPVVLDDVLMSHDDERSRNALVLLAQLGANCQVILLTHHRAVAEMAAELTGVATCELGAVALV